IQKIQDREYVATTTGGGTTAAEGDDEEPDETPATRGGGRGRGRGGRGRGGGGSARGGRGSGLKVFVPTQLGVALILGFDRMSFETSLGKPFLRKEMELQMKAICEGSTTRRAVLDQSIAQYRQVFLQSQEQVGVLKQIYDALIEQIADTRLQSRS
ncbi:hypothetical protein TARUN_3061, partial [Trichoderma arundinaceum]